MDGGGWGRSGDADGLRRAESQGCRSTGFRYPDLLPTGYQRSPYLQELRLQPRAQSQMSAAGAATSPAFPAATLAASHRIRAETSPCAPPGGQRVPDCLRARPRTPPFVREELGPGPSSTEGCSGGTASALKSNSQTSSLGILFSQLILDAPSGEWHSVSQDLEPELSRVCPLNDPFIYELLGTGICPQL